MCISIEKAQYSIININPRSKKIQWKYPYQRETRRNRPGLSKVIEVSENMAVFCRLGAVFHCF